MSLRSTDHPDFTGPPCGRLPATTNPNQQPTRTLLMHHARKFVVLLGLGLALPLAAQDSGKSVFQSSLIASYNGAAGKIVQLANAFTDEQLAWRPSEGVRSTREAILHVAAANYFMGSKLGAKIPEGVNPGEIEKFEGSKADMIALLEQSSEFVRAGGQRRARGRPRQGYPVLWSACAGDAVHAHPGRACPRAPRPVDRLCPVERRHAAVEQIGATR